MLSVGSETPKETQQWKISLRTASSAGLLQPQNKSLPCPEQLKRVPIPPKPSRKANAGIESGWLGQNARKLCHKPGVSSAGNSQLRCWAVRTPRWPETHHAGSGRAQPTGCGHMVEPSPAPRSQILRGAATGAQRHPKGISAPISESNTPEGWRAAACLWGCSAPCRVAQSFPSPQSLLLGLYQDHA